MNSLILSLCSAAGGASTSFLLAVFREYYVELCRRKSTLTTLVCSLHPLSFSVWQGVQVTLGLHKKADFMRKFSPPDAPQGPTARLKGLSIEDFDLRFICLDGNALLYDNIKFVTTNLKELPELADLYNAEPTLYNRHQFIISGAVCTAGIADITSAFNAYYASYYGASILPRPAERAMEALRASVEYYILNHLRSIIDQIKVAATTLPDAPALRHAYSLLIESAVPWRTAVQAATHAQDPGIFQRIMQQRPESARALHSYAITLRKEIENHLAHRPAGAPVITPMLAAWELSNILQMYLEVLQQWGEKELRITDLLARVKHVRGVRPFIRKCLVRQSSFFSNNALSAHVEQPETIQVN